MSNSNDDTLVSVVIPFYNVRGYLDACLESVCGQSHQLLQIILVDDGSTDGSGEACERWAKGDDRVCVIHSANSGLSAARNLGMEFARGDYALFIDSDDMVGRDHVKRLLDATLGSPDPGLTVSVTGFTTVGDSVLAAPLPGGPAAGATPLKAAEAISASVTVGAQFAAHAWGKLYPKTLFPLLHYPVGRYYEDQFVTYKVFLGAAHILYVDADDYFYRLGRPGSISVGGRVRELDYLDAIRETLGDVKASCPDSVPAVEARYLAALSGGVETARLAGRDGLYHELFGEAREASGAARACRSLSRASRLRYALLAMGPGAYARAIDLKALAQSFPSKASSKLARTRRERAGRTDALSRLSADVSGARGGRAFLVMTPRYRNYGDHLIAFSERQLLEEAGWEDVVEIPYEDCRLIARDFGALLRPGDTVFFTGGGYLGDLWPDLERTVEGMLPGIGGSTPVVFFPESVYYTDGAYATSGLIDAVGKRGSTVTMLAREKATLGRLDLPSGGLRTKLLPDAALLLRREMLVDAPPERVPGRALVCVRRDKEGLQGSDFGVRLTRALLDRGYSIRAVDTHDPAGELEPGQRREALGLLAAKFGSASLVVTNRLHAMVLALIMGTPCVALDNLSGKISGVAEWVLGRCPLVLASEERISEAIDAASSLEPNPCGLDGLLEEERAALLGLVAEAR